MFATGHVKRNPETGAVAVKTHFPADDPVLGRRAWQMATVNTGGRAVTESEVLGWDDLYVPEEGS